MPPLTELEIGLLAKALRKAMRGDELDYREAFFARQFCDYVLGEEPKDADRTALSAKH